MIRNTFIDASIPNLTQKVEYCGLILHFVDKFKKTSCTVRPRYNAGQGRKGNGQKPRYNEVL